MEQPLSADDLTAHSLGISLKPTPMAAYYLLRLLGIIRLQARVDRVFHLPMPAVALFRNDHKDPDGSP